MMRTKYRSPDISFVTCICVPDDPRARPRSTRDLSVLPNWFIIVVASCGRKSRAITLSLQFGDCSVYVGIIGSMNSCAQHESVCDCRGDQYGRDQCPYHIVWSPITVSGLALGELSRSSTVGVPHFHFCSASRRSLSVANCDEVSIVGDFLGSSRHCLKRVVEGSNIYMKLLGLLANGHL